MGAGSGTDGDDSGLLIDRIDTLRIVRAESDQERDELLRRVAGHGHVEREMTSELSAVRPLAHPERFEEAHHLVVRGIEVLNRNGPRQPEIRRLAFLSPVARWITQQGVQFIVRNHLQSLTKTLLNTYVQREASCDWSSPDHSRLRRCRLDMKRVHDGMDRRALGLPGFIFGGAILTSAGSGLQNAFHLAKGSRTWAVVAAVILVAVLVALSWAALFSAAVARHRIRISVEQPLAALWETIGAAGRPPKDDSFHFAVYAIILLVLSWIVVPFALWMAVVAG